MYLLTEVVKATCLCHGRHAKHGKYDRRDHEACKCRDRLFSCKIAQIRRENKVSSSEEHGKQSYSYKYELCAVQFFHACLL